MKKSINIFICIILTAMLLGSWIQLVFKPFQIYPLNGFVVIPDSVNFEWKKWFEGEYQIKKENELKLNSGFSNQFIKLKNQIEFTLFSKLNANGVVMGKENCLYEYNYIRAFTGNDYLGEDSIRAILHKVKTIQDTLEKYNKHLLLVFCPGKASFFPEYIPEKYLVNKKENTNMRSFISISEEMEIHQLNLHDYFLLAKDTANYPLFLKNGIHWSEYGDALVVMKFNEYFKNQFHLPQAEIYIKEIVCSDQPKGRDYDIAGSLNLLFKLPCPKMAYPVFEVKNKPNNLPNSIVVSDSYYWGIFGKGHSSLLFNNNDFWYYHKESYNNKNFGAKVPTQLNMQDEINKNDVFIIMATEATIFEFGWGFINRMYENVVFKKESYKHNDKQKERINYWKNYIYKDAKWLNDLKIRAEKSKISLDSAVMQDAIYQTDIGK